MADTPRGDLGGSFVMRGPGRRWGVVHVGPEPGVCQVDTDGCGYCIGVPCQLPNPAKEGTDDARPDPAAR